MKNSKFILQLWLIINLGLLLWPEDACAKEKVLRGINEGAEIIFMEGQKITCTYFHLRQEVGWRFETKWALNGIEQDEGYGSGWSYTITGSDIPLGGTGATVEFWIEATKLEPDGTETKVKTYLDWTEEGPIITHRTLALFFHAWPGYLKENVVVATFDVPPIIFVNVHYNDSPKGIDESVVHPSLFGNYPEVAFLTFVLTEKREDDGPILTYDNIPLWFRISCVDIGIPYHIVNLTKNGLPYLNMRGPKGDPNMPDPYYYAKNWQGFHFLIAPPSESDYPRVDTLFGALAAVDETNGNDDHPDLKQDYVFTVGTSPTTIGVKTWNYTKEFTRLKCTVAYRPSKVDPLVRFKSCVKFFELNIDNVALERSNFISKDGSINWPHLPLFTEPFDVDPGNFIMYLGSHTFDAVNPWGGEPSMLYGDYKNMPNVLADIETDKLPASVLKGDGYLDWMQVAAADIYNNPKDDEVKRVFDCVWGIRTHYTDESPFSAFGSVPYVSLNTGMVELRFNSSGYTGYGFYDYKSRDNAVHHEAFHHWLRLPGYWVTDNDNDRLYCNHYQHRDLLRFSKDFKLRGFQYRNNESDLTYNGQRVPNLDCVRWRKRWTLGGDSYWNDNGKGYFLFRIDDKMPSFVNPPEIFPDSFSVKGWLCKVPSPVPADLPYGWPPHDYTATFDLYLYNPVLQEEFLVKKSISTWGLFTKEGEVVKTSYGKYTTAIHDVYVGYYTGGNRGYFHDMLEGNSDWQIWALLTFKYPSFRSAVAAVEEFDCELFGITHGEK